MRTGTKASALFLITCALASTPQKSVERNPLAEFPAIVLWAWENPESLPFLDPNFMGVAYLAGTIALGNGQLRDRPRMQPLSVPVGTKSMAAIRLESRLDSELPAVGAVAAKIHDWETMPGTVALQIDFDARLSERVWYRDLLRQLHTDLPMPLLITALASWCEQDGWIRGLPVAEAVPMLFRMGAGELWNGQDSRRLRLTGTNNWLFRLG